MNCTPFIIQLTHPANSQVSICKCPYSHPPLILPPNWLAVRELSSRTARRTIAHSDQHGVCARATAPLSTKASTASRRRAHPAPQPAAQGHQWHQRGQKYCTRSTPSSQPYPYPGAWLLAVSVPEPRTCRFQERIALCFNLTCGCSPLFPAHPIIHLDTIHSLTTENFVLGTAQFQFLNLLNSTSDEGSAPSAKPSAELSSPNPRRHSDPMDGQRKGAGHLVHTNSNRLPANQVLCELENQPRSASTPVLEPPSGTQNHVVAP
jgi:hypothetical protein